MTARLEALAEQMRMNHGRIPSRRACISYVKDYRQLASLRRNLARRKEQVRATEIAIYGPQVRLACQVVEDYALEPKSPSPVGPAAKREK